MKFELNDLTPLLDLLAQPAFCTEGGVVCYCNRPARDRGLKTGVSAASLLGAGAELPAPGGAPRQVILNLHDALASASVLPSESGYLFLLSPAVSESVPPQALLAAAQADFSIAIYNPASHGRPEHLARACEILLRVLPENRLCGIVRNIGREGQSHRVLTLQELQTAPVDMFCTVFIGNSSTKELSGALITPRGYRNV